MGGEVHERVGGGAVEEDEARHVAVMVGFAVRQLVDPESVAGLVGARTARGLVGLLVDARALRRHGVQEGEVAVPLVLAEREGPYAVVHLVCVLDLLPLEQVEADR